MPIYICSSCIAHLWNAHAIKGSNLFCRHHWRHPHPWYRIQLQRSRGCNIQSVATRWRSWVVAQRPANCSRSPSTWATLMCFCFRAEGACHSYFFHPLSSPPSSGRSLAKTYRRAAKVDADTPVGARTEEKAHQTALLAGRCARHTRPETDRQSLRTLISRIPARRAATSSPPPSLHLGCLSSR